MKKAKSPLKKIAVLLSASLLCYSPFLFAEANKAMESCQIKSYETGIRYQQQSAEIAAIRLQTYALATLRLQQILEKNQGKADKLAIVADVDETIIDNSPLLARDMARCHDFTTWDTWGEWEKYGNPKLIPGALDFFNYANKAGVKIFYVSDRFQENKAATLATLKALGLPQVSDESVLLYYTSKEERRALVRKDYQIVMLLGDSLPDFSKDFTSKTPLNEQHQQVMKNSAHFGVDWIVFPNASYGNWSKAPLVEWDRK